MKQILLHISGSWPIRVRSLPGQWAVSARLVFREHKPGTEPVARNRTVFCAERRAIGALATWVPLPWESPRVESYGLLCAVCI